jgi:hypothetical protein
VTRALRRIAIAAVVSSLGCSTELPRTRITSDPPGARVTLDDLYVGETPVSVALDARTHRVRIEKEGFETLTAHISPKSRAEASVAEEMFGTPRYGFRPSYFYELERVKRR